MLKPLKGIPMTLLVPKARTLLLAGLLTGLLVLALSLTARAEPILASYYGEELAGAPTATGELYDPYGSTAAHPYLPFGTVLEVCYQECTPVVINDRNPLSASDLDLSRAAADSIGLTPVGYGTVDVQVVE